LVRNTPRVPLVSLNLLDQIYSIIIFVFVQLVSYPDSPDIISRNSGLYIQSIRTYILSIRTSVLLTVLEVFLSFRLAYSPPSRHLEVLSRATLGISLVSPLEHVLLLALNPPSPRLGQPFGAPLG
jgi:hypothetical protein